MEPIASETRPRKNHPQADAPGSSPKGTSRLARLRDNKRRSRERQKQYICELERRCQQHREAGIQASIELQGTARKVAAQNERLRALLAALHVGEDVVERWIRGDDGVLEEIETRKGAGGDSAGEGKDGCGSKLDPVANTPSLCNTKNAEIPPTITSTPSPEPSTCQLLSQLKLNPSIDLRNLPDTGGSAPYSAGEDGVPCSRAYEMLIQHATTDEKLVDIAHMLEKGCTKSEGGGCVVKNSAIWTALDSVCLQ